LKIIRNLGGRHSLLHLGTFAKDLLSKLAFIWQISSLDSIRGILSIFVATTYMGVGQGEVGKTREKLSYLVRRYQIKEKWY
jgi:hypothetical protein